MTGLWPEGSGGKVLKFDGAFAPKVLRFDSPFGLRDEYKVNVTGISSLCFRHPKHGGELATSGGFFSPLVPLFPRSKGGCTVFPRAKPGFKGFLYIGGKAAHHNPHGQRPCQTLEPARPKGRVHKAAHHNPRGLKGRVKLKPLKNLRPEGPSTLTPEGPSTFTPKACQ